MSPLTKRPSRVRGFAKRRLVQSEKHDDNGKVVAAVDKDQKLSNSDKAFLKAIYDTKHHVTINAVGGEKDSSVFFGASHGSTHTINFDQAALLDSPKNEGGMTSAIYRGRQSMSKSERGL